MGRDTAAQRDVNKDAERKQTSGRWVVTWDARRGGHVTYFPNLWCHGGRGIAIATLLVSAEHKLVQDDVQEERLGSGAWIGRGVEGKPYQRTHLDLISLL